MKVMLTIEDADSVTGGDTNIARALLEEASMPLGMLLGRLDPDRHTWVVLGVDAVWKDQT